MLCDVKRCQLIHNVIKKILYDKTTFRRYWKQISVTNNAAIKRLNKTNEPEGPIAILNKIFKVNTLHVKNLKAIIGDHVDIVEQ